MADELSNALDQLITDLETITNIQRAQLGQMLESMPEATHSKCVAAVYMMRGRPDNSTYTSTTEYHEIEVKLYWQLQPINVEVVESAVASMWDLLMTKFFGDDADRNLSDKTTIALISGTDGTVPYQVGYEEIGGKLHRVMIVPFEIVLDTHSV